MTLERFGRTARSHVGSLIERMVGVAFHPFESVASADYRSIDLFQQLDVHHGLAVTLAPPFGFPSRHPFGHRIDHVLAVTQHEEVVVGSCRGTKQVEDRHQLTLIVGGVGPPASGPPVIVDVPGPSGGSGITECGAVSGSDDGHGSSLPGAPPATVGLAERSVSPSGRSRLAVGLA